MISHPLLCMQCIELCLVQHIIFPIEIEAFSCLFCCCCVWSFTRLDNFEAIKKNNFIDDIDLHTLKMVCIFINSIFPDRKPRWQFQLHLRMPTPFKVHIKMDWNAPDTFEIYSRWKKYGVNWPWHPHTPAIYWFLTYIKFNRRKSPYLDTSIFIVPYRTWKQWIWNLSFYLADICYAKPSWSWSSIYTRKYSKLEEVAGHESRAERASDGGRLKTCVQSIFMFS